MDGGWWAWMAIMPVLLIVLVAVPSTSLFGWASATATGTLVADLRRDAA